MFPLDCCVYVTASHLSIACAVPLPLINGILLLLENLAANSRHLQRVSGTQTTYSKQNHLSGGKKPYQLPRNLTKHKPGISI